MSAADHAATIREILDAEGTFIYRRDEFLAALDALQAKAETAETLPPAHSAQWWQEVAEDLDERVKKMRSERDAAVHERERLRTKWQAEAASNAVAFSKLKAERNAAVQAAEERAAEINRLTDNIARDMAAIKAAEQAAEQAEEISNGYARALLSMTEKKQAAEHAAEQLKKDVDRYTAHLAAANQAAEQARAALQKARDYIADDDPGDADTGGFHARLMTELDAALGEKP